MTTIFNPTVGQILGITAISERPALLVTPWHNFESTLLELPTGDNHLAWFYEHLDCSCVTCLTPMRDSILHRMGMRFGVHLDCWGDDEGLLTAEPVLNRTITSFTNYPAPLVGNWIILASDDEGETLPLPVPFVRFLIKYLPLTPSGTSAD